MTRLQPIIVFALVLRYGAGVPVVAAQEDGRCAPADRFLTEELVMVTRIDPDTLDDWRTGKRLAACRITAVGTRKTTLAVAARVFYEKVRAAGWTRTPDPRDSPNEASLRFRLGETDCLFNVYQGILLGTDSEIEVTNAVETRPGEELYHVLVLCVPAMEARTRDRSARPPAPLLPVRGTGRSAADSTPMSRLWQETRR